MIHHELGPLRHAYPRVAERFSVRPDTEEIEHVGGPAAPALGGGEEDGERGLERQRNGCERVLPGADREDSVLVQRRSIRPGSRDKLDDPERAVLGDMEARVVRAFLVMLSARDECRAAGDLASRDLDMLEGRYNKLAREKPIAKQMREVRLEV